MLQPPLIQASEMKANLKSLKASISNLYGISLLKIWAIKYCAIMNNFRLGILDTTDGLPSPIPSSILSYQLLFGTSRTYN